MMFKKGKKIIGKSLLKRIFFFAFLFGLSLSVKAQTAKTVEEIVESVSGGKLRVETKATPYKLAADLNGDKVEDVAVVVELLELPKNISPTVKKVYPYYTQEVSKNDLALLIIHGKGKGWQYAQKETILLVGSNSALIFEKSRLDEKGDAIEIKKDKNGRVKLLFSTEGSEGYLKWNGKKYVWWETNP